jgi:hypothetical protein
MHARSFPKLRREQPNSQKGNPSQSTAGKWGGVVIVLDRRGSLTFQKGTGLLPKCQIQQKPLMWISRGSGLTAASALRPASITSAASPFVT